MQNDMRDRLIELLSEIHSKKIPSMGEIADHLIANGVILPPCNVGETLYLVQIGYKGNYHMASIVVDSKITMFSILRAYEEKTIVYMSTDKIKAEQKLKEMRADND